MRLFQGTKGGDARRVPEGAARGGEKNLKLAVDTRAAILLMSQPAPSTGGDAAARRELVL